MPLTGRSRRPIRSIEAEAAVLSKAVSRTADRLNVTNVELSEILGVSASTVSRLKAGTYTLSVTGGKEFELAAMFVRLFRGLDAIVGGDDASAQSWLRTSNTALAAKPIDLIRTAAGLTSVLLYVDAQRARI